MIRLTQTQGAIVSHEDGPLLVVAGPGSGKTRVLTERIRRLLQTCDGHFRILALTFTNKAANEMKERLNEFPDIERRAFIGTLHSFCMEVLANRGKPVGIERLSSIFESYQDRKRVLYQAVMGDPALRAELAGRDRKCQDELLSRWLDMISSAKNQLHVPEAIPAETERKVYVAYDSGLRASDAIDFDDLLLLTYRLFIERPKIANFYRRLYRYIAIDEAQDLNFSQYEVLRALCGDEYRNVMMVGDPKQAIYGWNDASPEFMNRFEVDFGARRLEMNDNFRSTEALVLAARRLDPTYTLEGTPALKGEIELLVGSDEEDEAAMVLDRLESLLTEGHPDVEGRVTLDRCALLGRTRYVLGAAEKGVKERNWPYYKQLSAQHESESDLLKDFELCLRLLANPRDRLHNEALLVRWKAAAAPTRAEPNGDVNEMIEALQRAAGTTQRHLVVVEALRAMSLSAEDFRFGLALDRLELSSKSLDEEDRALVLQDIAVWRKHWDVFLRRETGGTHSLGSFLGQVALGSTQQPRHEGLALLTVHSAKGLEFDVLGIMGMAEGTFPDYRARGTELEEEKRNAFVAVTRSRRILIVSYPKTKRMPWGADRNQRPSRFLREIVPGT